MLKEQFYPYYQTILPAGKNLTEQDKEYIVKIGPPKNPKSFPRDSSGRNFPQIFFLKK